MNNKRKMKKKLKIKKIKKKRGCRGTRGEERKGKARVRRKGEGRGDWFVITLQILWCIMIGFSWATCVKMYVC
jgi:hypothetical protein